jgi:hypothetical protein
MTSTINASTSAGLVQTADTSGVLALQTAGTTAVTVDASQNVGIGTSSPTSKLVVSGGSLATSGLAFNVASGLATGKAGTYDAGTLSAIHSYSDNASMEMSAGTSANYVSAISCTGTAATNYSATIRFTTYSAERMRIDSSGNVGIGNSTARAHLDINDGTVNTNGDVLKQVGITAANVGAATTATGLLTIQSNDALAADVGGSIAFGGRYITSGTAAANWAFIAGLKSFATSGDLGGYLQFSTRASSGGAVSEKMRITDSGTVMINSTTQVDSAKFQVVGATSSNNLIVLQDTGTTYSTSQFYQKFLNSSAAVAGSIQHTAVTTVAYSTTSDGRLKEDKGIATDMSVIDNTVIHDFVWKLDGLVDRGIFAQEAHLVKPTAISIGNDELTEDGNLRNPWGVDYSKYVPELIVYCQQLKKITQEQQAIITQLQADVAALKGA